MNLKKIATGAGAGAIGLTALFFLNTMTDEVTTRRVLEENNLKPVQVGGHAYFMCVKKGDMRATSFIATNDKGEEVKGAVCTGYQKTPYISTKQTIPLFSDP